MQAGEEAHRLEIRKLGYDAFFIETVRFQQVGFTLYILLRINLNQMY